MKSRNADDRVAEIRRDLDHPIVDADGHWLESIPLLLEYIDREGGPGSVDRFIEFVNAGDSWYGMTHTERLNTRFVRPLFWGEAGNTLDRATAILPDLLAERLPQLGIDFAVLYPTLGLFLQHLHAADLRRVVIRAHNRMAADLFRKHSAIMTPAALVPTYTPDEAMDEVDFAVRELGFKTVMINGNVRRALPPHSPTEMDFRRVPSFVDSLALDSPLDYNPLWARLEKHGLAVACHGQGSLQWPNRMSVSNMNFNHAGHFAEAGHAFCKAVFFAGLYKKYPRLRFAFLEGGIAWGCLLFADLAGKWEKRSAPAMLKSLSPANTNTEEFRSLVKAYGGDLFGNRVEDTLRSISAIAYGKSLDELTRRELPYIDEFSELGVSSLPELTALFRDRNFFGCEADDRTIAWAFDQRVGMGLKPVFSSDIGHFDVTEMAEVLVEARELVDDGLLTPRQFREFTFENPVTLHTAGNPDFFKGTVVEAAAEKLLSGTPRREPAATAA
jgi:predicted TIM-barrel fold metal-dependent hydrolase